MSNKTNYLKVTLNFKNLNYVKFFLKSLLIILMNFIKDITKLGRDMKKIIIVDNLAENF